MLILLIVMCVVWVLYWAFAYWRDGNSYTPGYISRYQCADCAEVEALQLHSSSELSPVSESDAEPFDKLPVREKTAPIAAEQPKALQPETLQEAPQFEEQTSPGSVAKIVDEGSNIAANDAAPTVVPLFVAPAEADDLKKIKGVGVVMERTLNELGIATFKQLAEFQDAEVKMVTDALDQANSGFGDRITRDEWVSQAQMLFRKAS